MGNETGAMRDVLPVGAHTEYHFLPEAVPRGGWTVACFRPGASQRAWQMVQEGHRKVMVQTVENTDRGCHPPRVAGDPRWRDYRLEVTFLADGEQAASGVVFR